MSALTGDALYQGMAERPLHVVHAANEKVGSPRPGARALRRFEEQAELVCLPASCSSRQCRTSALCRHLLCRLFCAYPSAQALLLESVDRQTGREAGYKRSVGAGTDSYYEYLLK